MKILFVVIIFVVALPCLSGAIIGAIMGLIDCFMSRPKYFRGHWQLIKEIFGQNYDFSYRWFRFRELIHLPSYAAEEKRSRQKRATFWLTWKK